MGDAEVLGPGLGRDRAPRRVAPFRALSLTVQVEARLTFAHVETSRAEQCDSRRRESLLERRPHWAVLSPQRSAALIERTEAARQEPVAVDDHGQEKSDSVPRSTGITEPPTSIRSGMSFDSPYVS